MHTLTLTAAPDDGPFPRSLSALKAKCRQIAPMAGIVVAHLIVFYLLQNGMLQRVVHAALPEVINVSFIAPPPPPVAAPAEAKTVRLAAPMPPPTLVPPLPPPTLVPPLP
ncbi:MAG TPA: energy transducer TonB, partial [Janthinobacterium sp.]|nr:energy transducer TonB [Janthinobacterium sp.]